MLKQIFSFIGCMLIATQAMGMDEEKLEKEQNTSTGLYDRNFAKDILLADQNIQNKEETTDKYNAVKMLLLDHHMQYMQMLQVDVHMHIGRALHELRTRYFTSPSVEELKAHLVETPEGYWDFVKDDIILEIQQTWLKHKEDLSSFELIKTTFTGKDVSKGYIYFLKCIYENDTRRLVMEETNETIKKYDRFIDYKEIEKRPDLKRLHDESAAELAHNEVNEAALLQGEGLIILADYDNPYTLNPQDNIVVSFVPKIVGRWAKLNELFRSKE